MVKERKDVKAWNQRGEKRSQELREWCPKTCFSSQSSLRVETSISTNFVLRFICSLPTATTREMLPFLNAKIAHSVCCVWEEKRTAICAVDPGVWITRLPFQLCVWISTTHSSHLLFVFAFLVGLLFDCIFSQQQQQKQHRQQSTPAVVTSWPSSN